VALQDHCSYKAPTTNHHVKQTKQCLFQLFPALMVLMNLSSTYCPRFV